jgi:hypothetical protein
MKWQRCDRWLLVVPRWAHITMMTIAIVGFVGTGFIGSWLDGMIPRWAENLGALLIAMCWIGSISVTSDPDDPEEEDKRSCPR